MATSVATSRKDRSRQWTTVINIVLLLGLAGIGISTSLLSAQSELGRIDFGSISIWWTSFWQNFSTEMYGAFLTFLLLELVVGGRQNRQAEDQQKNLINELQDQLRGMFQGQEIASLLAAETTEEREPILRAMQQTDLLHGADLQDANLQAADLMEANLHGANLMEANLQAADLWQANLQAAYLMEANLQAADLWIANLQAADLRSANLQAANLRSANLQAARLESADLRSARYVSCDQLRAAKSLEGATLPDGTQLPGRTAEEELDGAKEPDWRTAFEEWCKTVETHGGYIIPAPMADGEQGE